MDADQHKALADQTGVEKLGSTHMGIGMSHTWSRQWWAGEASASFQRDLDLAKAHLLRMPIPLDPWDQSMRWQHGWKFFSPRLPSVNLEFLYLGQKRTMTNWVMVDGWPILADRFAISPPKPFWAPRRPDTKVDFGG